MTHRHLVLLLILAAPGGARAGLFTVSSLADAGAGTLRSAVAQANAAPGSTITFNVSGTIALTSGVLTLTTSMTITGPGAASLTVSGSGQSGVFNLVNTGAAGISGLTITGGSALQGAGILLDAGSSLTLTGCVVKGNTGSSNGGGIFSRGTLKVAGCLIDNNSGGNSGGGIYVEGTASLADTIVSNNTSSQGGGMNPVGAVVTIDRSTFTGNKDGVRTGGIWLEGGTLTATNSTFSGDSGGATGELTATAGATMNLLNCTIAGGNGVFNSGIASVQGSTVNLRNTLLAGAGNQCKLAGGTIVSQGHNLATDATCGLAAAGDQQNAKPLLNALANNGGPTPTMTVMACSPAINGGDNNAVPAVDQRGNGHARILYGTVDIGAVEYDIPPVPCILAQPMGQTIFATQQLSLTVGATSPNSMPTYQWRRNGANLQGATAATYAKAAAVGDAGNYDVVVSNAFGSVTSNVAVVVVNGPPMITAQPASQTLFATQAFSLSVTAAGLGLSYQWRRNGVNLGGAVAATYMKANAVLGDAGNYDVVVTNPAGSVTSAAAAVVVNGPPAITAQPMAQTLFATQTISLSVTAAGTGLAYQWRKNGVNLGGAVAATYMKANAVLGDAGNYDVVVTNPAGSATSSAAAVVVNGPPMITAQPMSQSLSTGQTISLSVTAVGQGLAYQWRQDQMALGGAVAPIYMNANATVADSGSYDVVVSNPAGSVTSTMAQVMVVEPMDLGISPDLAIPPDLTLSEVDLGEAVDLGSQADDSGNPMDDLGNPTDDLRTGSDDMGLSTGDLSGAASDGDMGPGGTPGCGCTVGGRERMPTQGLLGIGLLIALAGRAAHRSRRRGSPTKIRD